MQILRCLFFFFFLSIFLANSTSVKKVEKLPGSSSITDTSYAGFVTVDARQDANLFFWFFECRNNPKTAPVVLWMTGGPGCSSELAVVFENGPFSIKEDLTLQYNPYSWSEVANVIYIDQPYGTGFSYTKGPGVTNENQMADDMYTFLQIWFTQLFPQYLDNPFFITGESFAGHYVPALSARVVAGNEQNSGQQKLNLVGSAIGNGWVDPEIQYGSYAPYGLMNNLIDKKEYLKLNETYKTCKNLIEEEEWLVAELECSNLMGGVLQSAGNINIYNIDLPCVVPGLCYNFTTQTDYMNLRATQEALGVDKVWSTCSTSQITVKDNIGSFRFDIPKVLAANVRVMIYNGMLDLICNYVGGYQWTYSMPWPSMSSFQSAPLDNWKYQGKTAAHIKQFNNFSFLEVESAGHMVPHDQPAFALEMISLFLKNQLPSS